MSQRVFVKVMGFSDVERHALNTVFRLSEGREVVYTLWTPGAPDAPQVALVDGQSYEGGIDLSGQDIEGSGMRLIWVGAVAPAHSWLTFTRPLRWSDIVKGMDGAFMPPEPLDLDLDRDSVLDLDLSVYPEDHSQHADTRSALVVAADVELRLYLRAKLSSLGITRVYDARTVNEAIELASGQRHSFVLLDLDMTGPDDWQLYRALRFEMPRSRFIVMTRKYSLGLKFKAWMAGAKALLKKPLHPGLLHRALMRK